MKRYQKATLAVLLALLVLTLGAAVATRDWSNYRERLRKIRLASNTSSQLVDTHPLDTAEQLAPLAATRTEQDYAQQAAALGDRSVDFAFSAALRDAAENPAPPTSQTRDLAARIKAAQAVVAADQAQVAQLTQQVAKGRAGDKDNLQEQLDLAQAKLSLDQDELDDAHQDLIRAGGDRQANIRQRLGQHEASMAHNADAHTGAAGTTAAPSIELTKSRSVAAALQAWLSLRSKEELLRRAQQDALARSAKLSAAHEALEKEVSEEKSQRKILHKSATTSSAAAEPESAIGPAQSNSELSFLRDLAGDQKNLSEFDKRIETEQQLAAVYGNWIDLVGAREKAFVHTLFVSVFWILLIALLVWVANHWVQRFFADLALERRLLHTARALILFVLQALGLVLILLVIFGVPGNFATVLALVGAGLTVAMKDFIVGFFGWFVLMGKDGIRPGDWVEINGVGGEVLEVGLLHTVILETGNWTEAGHPTGRKVSFVNSFAIEGHYFNFSTSGQWLWDEIQVQIPESAEPYAVAEAIQKIAAEETAANARLAEEEWSRVTPSPAKRSFSAAPSLGMRPTGSGVNVVVRYITRASERSEVRARLYRAVVELLHKKKIPESAAKPPQQPVAGRA